MTHSEIPRPEASRPPPGPNPSDPGAGSSGPHGPSKSGLDRYARIAGVGYLVIIVAGIYAEFFVRSGLIVPGNATATAENIVASEALFRSALASEFVMLLCDVLVAAALYMVFRGVNRGLALLAASFRLVHAAIVGANLLNTYIPLLLLSGGGGLSAFGADQLHALTLVFLQAHGYGYAIGLVFFGAQCLALGWLILQSRYVPRVLGFLLLLAAAGYLIDSFGRTLLADYASVESIFTLLVFTPAFVAELSFAVWLVVKGVNVPDDATA